MRHDLKQISKIIVDRLISDTDFRSRFQKAPLEALRECGCPDECLPSIETVSKADFIELGMKIESMRGGRVGAIAVACVVI